MNKEKRLRRLKAIVGAQKIITVASQRYVVEIPGYSLRGSTRSDSPHEAVNQLIQEWVREGRLNPSVVEGPLRVRLQDFQTKESVDIAVPIEEALAGSTSYSLPDFGGYSSEPAELGPNVEEYERTSPTLSEQELGAREDVMGDVSSMELVEPRFNEPRILVTDPTFSFEPKDINALIYRSNNKEWISVPEVSRRKSIPHLYVLNGSPTDHEKYFGVKTEYGYVPTIASAILFRLATQGGAPRGDMLQLLKLKIPEDYPISGQVSEFLITLPAHIEEAAIRDSFGVLQEAHQKPSLLRQIKYQPGTDNFHFTTSHSRGWRETPPSKELSQEMKKRVTVVNRGLSKDIAEYAKLNSMVQDFIGQLDAKMGLLLKEQHAVNASSRFLRPSGKRDAVEDVLKGIMLRKIIGALQSAEPFYTEAEDITSPLSDTELEEGKTIVPA